MENEHEFGFVVGAPGQPTRAIFQAVAQVKGTKATELDPIENVIDSDSLEEIMGNENPDDFYRSSGDGKPDTLRIQFEYEGCIVEVTPGRFTVERI